MSFSEINEHQTPSSTEELPVLRNLSPSRPSSRKERGVPSVTPRKFKKFFTPQCYGSAPTSRSALIEITTFGSNRTTLSSPLRPFRNSLSQDSSALGYVARESKRRKVYNAIESEKEIGLYGASHGGGMSSPCERAVKSFGDTDSESESEEEDVLPQPVPAKRIVRIEGRGLSGQLLRRSIGSNTRQRYAYPINGSYARLHATRPSLTFYRLARSHGEFLQLASRRSCQSQFDATASGSATSSTHHSILCSRPQPWVHAPWS